MHGKGSNYHSGPIHPLTDPRMNLLSSFDRHFHGGCAWRCRRYRIITGGSLSVLQGATPLLFIFLLQFSHLRPSPPLNCSLFKVFFLFSITVAHLPAPSGLPDPLSPFQVPLPGFQVSPASPLPTSISPDVGVPSIASGSFSPVMVSGTTSLWRLERLVVDLQKHGSRFRLYVNTRK